MIFILNIIENFYLLLQLFIPGFIFLKILGYIRTIDNKSETFIILWSVVISYIFVGVVKTFDSIIQPQKPLLEWSEIVICLALAAILPFLVNKVVNINKLRNRIEKTTGKSINNNLWRDAIDFDKGTVFKVFLKNGSVAYLGKVEQFEENAFDSWMLLTEYICMYTDREEEFDSTTSPNPTKVMIPLNEVERVELFYEE